MPRRRPNPPEDDLDAEDPLGVEEGPETTAADEVAAEAEAALAAEEAGEPEPVEPAAAPVPEPEPEPDPLELGPEDGDDVVIYNPWPRGMTLVHDGRFFNVRPQGCDLVPSSVANHCVGPNNQGTGTPHHAMGLRKLYGPIEGVRTREEAAAANEQFRADADAAYSAYLEKHPSLG